MTLYRTSGDSPIVTLADPGRRAGQAGGGAGRAEGPLRRGSANIEWARRLEEAGVHVVYGLVGLKTHTKTALVVREEPDGIRRYCHIGTGNYNSKTARIYEDLGLLTPTPRSAPTSPSCSTSSPATAATSATARCSSPPRSCRHRIEELIRNERRGRRARGRITLKMNSLVDPAMIEALYEASPAGVEIDLIVRGICCLRPGVPGLSENIRVRSIVGRYLEHSRIYRFANGAGGRPPPGSSARPT